jgi:hypothetical protein
LLNDRRIRIQIQEGQKHVDPVDPDSDPDPQHCLTVERTHLIYSQTFKIDDKPTKTVLVPSVSDPHLRRRDPDPALFVKFKYPQSKFVCLLLFEGTFTSIFKDKVIHKKAEIKVFLTIFA